MLPLRFRDLDAFGHVYHAEYLTFLDELRAAWFDGELGLDEPASYFVARAEIDYVSPLTADDQGVRGRFAVERVGNTSLTLRESLQADDGREVAHTRVVIVLRDPETETSRPLTAREREACERHADP